LGGAVLGRDIQDLWIVHSNGTVLFKRAYDERVDAQLFGGFMTALNVFASKISGTEGIHSFELGDKRFYLVKKIDMIFVGNSRKSKNAFRELELISQKFLNTYPIELLDIWNGDLSFFEMFLAQIEDSLERLK
jgi:hypothetical protein